MGVILVVDDDAAIHDTIRMVLSRAGYGVIGASNARDAIALMREGDQAGGVSVLLCDLNMPEMGGAELITHFNDHYPRIPIVVLSGAPDLEFLDAIVRKGVSDWIRKPATKDTILEKVRVAVRLHELRIKDHRT